jgi:hypothetical protein
MRRRLPSPPPRRVALSDSNVIDAPALAGDAAVAAHPPAQDIGARVGSVSGENLVEAVNIIGGSRSHLKTRKQAEEDAARERSRYRFQRRKRTKANKAHKHLTRKR